MTIHTDVRDGESRPLREVRTEVPEVIYVPRYTGLQRVNHWITAILFTLLTLSGLAMFTPFLNFLTALFGGGQATRAIHPWLGVALVVSFTFLFMRFWRLNIPNRDDVEWSKKIGDVVTNREDRLPELGKYNAGQKGVFWGQTILILVMFVTGLVIWNEYFGQATTIETQRWALLAHSLAAVIAIAIIFVHIYAGIWVRGTGRAMVRGTVTGGWAYRHHRKWLRQIAGTLPTRSGSVDKRGH
ncbi:MULTISPECIES: formate dehydrogenase subunit gamma [Methylobacterium]|uniref:Formate dehydrogenase, cytochrome b556(Fdo) subunit n=2 Tax=Pseudomonadota TaxID=1224 RepID=A0ABQ4T304_9HYPH|nr:MULTISPECIES: formate dehydrogenase subunit gamma [Methylobacterium]PIU07975.1 MAG: formate dehydrogenase subunit gamma [Methylobacterium sp. CG09_land_8_20_14_0_10_71_15]PIU15769.1 MAG: formate dehydrogenase subunit gamma [Methylobacterium sp. CG08_land_8_20_14_0_20_71_15]GBU17897.1 formate dehydrogenase-O cytochrome b556 subunit [Methylobacterium sp.]GJE08573.1 Formate dehydrogenase, cytochrome b556(fdo) subunit [Methylobacterium jeotgali]